MFVPDMPREQNPWPGCRAVREKVGIWSWNLFFWKSVTKGQHGSRKTSWKAFATTQVRNDSGSSAVSRGDDDKYQDFGCVLKVESSSAAGLDVGCAWHWEINDEWSILIQAQNSTECVRLNSRKNVPSPYVLETSKWKGKFEVILCCHGFKIFKIWNSPHNWHLYINESVINVSFDITFLRVNYRQTQTDKNFSSFHWSILDCKLNKHMHKQNLLVTWQIYFLFL